MEREDAQQMARELMNQHGLSEWSFRFDRARRRAGSCIHSRKEITLSGPLTTLYDARTVRGVILHEIAHALVGSSHNHDEVWQAKARELGSPDRARLSGGLPAPRPAWRGVCPVWGAVFHASQGHFVWRVFARFRSLADFPVVLQWAGSRTGRAVRSPATCAQEAHALTYVHSPDRFDPIQRTHRMTASTPFDDGATTNTGENRENLSWQQFGDASRELAQQIVNSGWMPDLIVAIARGGLIPAGALSYALGVKAIGTMNLEFYTGLGETLDEPQVLPPLMDVSAMDGKKVLVVDDVADSGKTLKKVMELIEKRGLSLDGQAHAKVEARSVVIYKKPVSIIDPDYVWHYTDLWINFPWSVLPVVQAQ